MTLGAVLIACAFGLMLGSFLNVVIDRVPKRESIVRPRSRCPRCGVAIGSSDNIPVLSWLVLRGRCRACGLAISAQYPAVEIVTAALFAGTAAHFGAGWNLAIFLVLFSGLIPLAVIDLKEHLLPVRIFYPVFVVDLALVASAGAATSHWRSLVIAIATGSGWFAIFFLINFFRPKLLGFGDVRLVALLGVTLGWLGLSIAFVAYFASAIFGLLVGLILIATKRAHRKTPIPFGLFLATGTVFAVFVGPVITSHLRTL